MRIPSGLARIPLWKRSVPKYPLYFKGDPQNRLFLPLFWMKMIPPKEEIPPNYVHFIVHPQMSRSDVKQYLEKIYNVPVLQVRTEVRMREIKANVVRDGEMQDFKQTHGHEEEKYAYVLLKDSTFKYPDFFKDGGQTEDMKTEESTEQHAQKLNKHIQRVTGNHGIPKWFT